MRLQGQPQNNSEIEKDLAEYPDKVADALEAWRTATAEKEKVEAMAYLRLKGASEAQEIERTVVELKAMTKQDDEVFQAVLKELKAEAQYIRLNEKLMAAKKLASLRTAY